MSMLKGCAFILFMVAALYGVIVWSIGWTATPKNGSFLGCGAIGMFAALIMVASETEPGTIIFGAMLIIASIAWLVASIKEEKAGVQREAEKKRMAALNKYKQEEKKQYDLAHTFGLEKYHAIDVDDERKYREGIQAMRQLGMMAQESVYQEKEKDWAIHGGIAEGIAGPAAGIMAAANIMQDNARIKAENAARRKWGAEQSFFYQNMAIEASARQPIPLSMSELSKKYAVISSWSPITLLSLIRIETQNVMIDSETGSVKITVKWSQKDKSLCIDGAIRAKLYTADKQCAGCAYMVLPKTGTASFKGTMDGVCAVPKPSSSYSVKFEPVDLWELAPKKSKSTARPEKLSKAEHQKIVADLESKYLKEIGA